MTQSPNREGPIVDALLAMPQQQRGAYLESACAGDLQLRRLMEAMLQAHEQGGALLDRNLGSASYGMVAHSLASEKPGDHIGATNCYSNSAKVGAACLHGRAGEGPVITHDSSNSAFRNT